MNFRVLAQKCYTRAMVRCLERHCLLRKYLYSFVCYMQVLKSVVFKIYKVFKNISPNLFYKIFCHMGCTGKAYFTKLSIVMQLLDGKQKMAVNVIFTSDFVCLLGKCTTLVL